MSDRIEPFLAQIITISGETIGVSIPIKYKRLHRVAVGDYVVVTLQKEPKHTEARV